mgnify:CR=1 FL=1
MSNKTIKTNLSYLRFSQGRVSQKAVSEATGIGQKTLSALETGASKGIEFNTLLKLCLFFNCTASDLLIIEDVAPAEEPVSDESRKRAKDLVARGLLAALQSPEPTPEKVWAEFDAVRMRMQYEADQKQKGNANKGQLSKRA